MYSEKIQSTLRLVLILIVVFTVVIVSKVFPQQQSLEVVFLDVGQGDATLITTPSKKQILIDGGKYRTIGTSLSSYMSVFDRSIDAVVATHPDTDHTGGLVSVVGEYNINAFYHPALTDGASAARELSARIERQNIPTHELSAGDVVILEPGIELEVLSPPPTITSNEPNEHSLVFRLTYGETSAMLMADASVYNEFDILNFFPGQLDSQILKVGHHGSKTSTAENFVDAVAPQYAVISAGCDNNFGHPHASVLETLLTRRIEIFDTCTDGDVVFASDGVTWENHTEK